MLRRVGIQVQFNDGLASRRPGSSKTLCSASIFASSAVAAMTSLIVHRAAATEMSGGVVVPSRSQLHGESISKTSPFVDVASS